MSLEHAKQLLHHDRVDEAESVLRELAKGTGASRRRACIELGRVCMRRGDSGRALEWFQDAWGSPADGAADELVQVEAARYLGELLERLGEWVQAEAVLRGAAEARLAEHGAEDVEYAALACSLAAVLLGMKKRGEARMLSEVAARTLWEAGDTRAVEGLLVRAMAIKATQGRHAEGLEPLYSLPEETQDALLREALVGQRHRAELLLPVLVEINAWHKKQREMSHPQVLALVAELSRNLGRHRERVDALEQLAGYFLRASDPEMHEHALVALARTHAELGRTERAVQLLVEAADVHPDGARLLREAGTIGGREDLLRQALTMGSDEEQARTATALGVLRMHRDQQEVESLLESGARLPSGDPDAQLARLHLVALREGVGCGCGEAAGAMSRALQEALFGELPEELIFLAGAVVCPAGVEIRLEMTREPAPAERSTIDAVVTRVRRRFERPQGA